MDENNVVILRKQRQIETKPTSRAEVIAFWALYLALITGLVTMAVLACK